jgi:hypothetical protein
MRQKFTYIGTKKSKSDLGYISTLTRYQSQNCRGFPLRGLCYKSKGCIESKSVFGQIKYNSQWNRFRLRELKKLNIEFTLVAITHNLRKWAKKTAGSLSFIKLSRCAIKKKRNIKTA